MKNILQVETLSKLSMDIYQHDDCIRDEKTADEILESMIEQLRAISKFVEWLDENDSLTIINRNTPFDLREKFDLYQIGDIINLLDSMKVKSLNQEKDETYLEFY